MTIQIEYKYLLELQNRVSKAMLESNKACDRARIAIEDQRFEVKAQLVEVQKAIDAMIEEDSDRYADELDEQAKLERERTQESSAYKIL